MISILITAEVRLYRDSLAYVLGRDERFRITASVSEREEIAGALRRERPDVVLLDIGLPRSVPALRRLTRLAPGVAVVALAVRQDEADILACAEAGAAGYVTADAPIDDLVETILAAARGELRCSASVAGTLFRRIGALAHRTETRAGRPGLTARETEVLTHIERGRSNKTIARELGIEVATVKNHVHNILGKLGVSGRGEAAAMTRQHAGPTA